MAKLRLNGTAGNDTINLTGQEGRLGVNFDGFEVFAGDGADRVTGSARADILRGEIGDDVLDGGQGNDVLFGGIGNDTLTGGAGNDKLSGGEGIDTASYAAQTFFVDVDLANGTAKVVSPTNLVVEQDALAGIENVVAGSGGSRIIGDGADNLLTGGSGRDDLKGGIGNDTLRGGAGNDTLDGGANNDVLLGGVGNDAIRGGDGIDTVSYAGQSNFIDVNLATGFGRVMLGIATVELDTLTGIENVTAGNDGSRLIGNGADNVLTGGNGNDELQGGAGNDTLIGGAGNDTFIGGTGDDTMEGGEGIDTVSYAGQGYVMAELKFVHHAFVSNTLGGPITQDDTLGGIENLIVGDNGSNLGGDDNDNVFTGGAGNDTMRSAGGKDTLFGKGGDDTLAGGGGDDTLSGGKGADIFAYNNIGDGLDTIIDFEVASVRPDFLHVGQYLSLATTFTGATAADAISQGYLVFVQQGTQGQSDFAAMVMVDQNGGSHQPQDMTSIFQLNGVAASALQAQHFLL